MANQCTSASATIWTHFLGRALTLAAACLAVGALGVSHACAQANVTFSGGMGAPIILTLNAPVTYVVTTAGANGAAPYFDFQGVGNIFGTGYGLSGTITFTVNGGAAQTLNFLKSGVSGGSVAAADAYLVGLEPGVALGSTVVLKAGTLTSGNTNFTGTLPAGGSYSTFLFDSTGTRLTSANGMAGPVPEPSTWALLGVGLGVLGVTLRRRRAR